MQHHQFIQVYKNVLSEKTCSELIHLFESSPDQQMRVDNHGRPNFSQICLNRMQAGEAYLPIVVNAMSQLFRAYCVTLKTYTDYLPRSFSIEEIRVKRYLNDGIDAFDAHVDVGDHLSASRYLAFLFYLNTVEEGGETVFQGLSDCVVLPKMGQAIVFPPNWQFPHRGKAPISRNKYVMSSYFQFK